MAREKCGRSTCAELIRPLTGGGRISHSLKRAALAVLLLVIFAFPTYSTGETGSDTDSGAGTDTVASSESTLTYNFYIAPDNYFAIGFADMQGESLGTDSEGRYQTSATSGTTLVDDIFRFFIETNMQGRSYDLTFYFGNLKEDVTDTDVGGYSARITPEDRLYVNFEDKDANTQQIAFEGVNIAGPENPINNATYYFNFAFDFPEDSLAAGDYTTTITAQVEVKQ